MEWTARVELARKALAAAVVFEGPDAEMYKQDFLFALRETDTFHPFNTDYALESLEEDQLFEMFCEMESLVLNHYADPWNHAPGYKAPAKVSADPEDALDEFEKLLDNAVV